MTLPPPDLKDGFHPGLPNADHRDRQAGLLPAPAYFGKSTPRYTAALMRDTQAESEA